MLWYILGSHTEKWFIFLTSRSANFAFILLKTVLSHNKIHTYIHMKNLLNKYALEPHTEQKFNKKSGIMHLKHCKG